MSRFHQLSLQYIPADDVLNEVKNSLNTYFNQGVLDESTLYGKLRWCLSKMGLKIYPTHTAVVHLDGNCAKLPEDFHRLVYALGCGTFSTTWTDTNPHYVEQEVVTFSSPCHTQLDYCTDDQGNMYKILEQYDRYTVHYSNLFDLRIAQDASPYCTAECFEFSNYRSPHEITIKNCMIYTNFTQGSVYLEYLSKLETPDGDLLIPDYPAIIEWIKDVLVVECFQYLYDNQIGDVIQRLQKREARLHISQENAKAVYRQFEVQDLFDLVKLNKARNKKYSTAVYGRTHGQDQSYRW
jgi:hypothetical protein